MGIHMEKIKIKNHFQLINKDYIKVLLLLKMIKILLILFNQFILLIFIIYCHNLTYI